MCIKPRLRLNLIAISIAKTQNHAVSCSCHHHWGSVRKYYPHRWSLWRSRRSRRTIRHYWHAVGNVAAMWSVPDRGPLESIQLGVSKHLSRVPPLWRSCHRARWGTATLQSLLPILLLSSSIMYSYYTSIIQVMIRVENHSMLHNLYNIQLHYR